MKGDFINITDYRISEANYFHKETEKKQIVFGNTMTSEMNHVKGWGTRLLGKTKKTAAYTIDINGNVYQHFNPKYYSIFVGNDEIDRQIISILIENEGWLTYNSEKNKFINWVGNIYNRTSEVIEKRWRGQLYWAPYNEAQLDAAVKLVKILASKFDIPQQCIPHNTKVDTITDYNGIVYRSNFEKFYNDLSPAWAYNDFKNKIELT